MPRYFVHLDTEPSLSSQGFAEFNQGVFGQFEVESHHEAESIQIVLEQKAKKLDSSYIVTLLKDRNCPFSIVAAVELKEFENADDVVVCDRRRMLSFFQTMFETNATDVVSQSISQSKTNKNGKQKRASKGRPKVRDYKADEKLVEDWSAAYASGNDRAGFCRSKGIQIKDLEAAQRSVKRRK